MARVQHGVIEHGEAVAHLALFAKRSDFDLYA
jgi:hypothetical protein